jgi:hypothetical protein
MPEGLIMYIQSYQIHNVLNVYRKQLSQGPGAKTAPSPDEPSVSDRVELSGNGQRQTLIDQVSTEIVDRIAQNSPQNRFEETLLWNTDRPRVNGSIRSVKKEVEFTYTTIDENDRKTTNSLPVRHFSPLNGQEVNSGEMSAEDSGQRG